MSQYKKYNFVTLIGEIASRRSFSHTEDYENFYQFDLKVAKANDGFEIFPIVASERVVHAGYDVGNMVKLHGKFQTEKSFITDKTKFSIFATDINLCITETSYQDANKVVLEGVLCRNPNYKISHFGKEICDILLAVKKNEDESEFIPCIAFGGTAKVLRKLRVGQNVKLYGRIKSKTLEKKNQSAVPELNKIYEVLVTKVEKEGGEVLHDENNSLDNTDTLQSRIEEALEEKIKTNAKEKVNFFGSSKLEESKNNISSDIGKQTSGQGDNNIYTAGNIYESKLNDSLWNKEESLNKDSINQIDNLKIDKYKNDAIYKTNIDLHDKTNLNETKKETIYQSNNNYFDNTNQTENITNSSIEEKKEPIFTYNFNSINIGGNSGTKSEKEKMLSGEIYDANHDQDLINERQKIQDLCYEYNNLKPSDMFWRKEHIKKMLGKIHGEFLIEQPFMCDYGYNIEIGENFYANHNLIILDAAKVKFGKNVFIGPNCAFYTAEHPLDAETRNKGMEYAKPIEVGNNVWFGGNVVVLSGVKIGDNAVIGAGSVVTKDIPANSVAVGNPCKVIKKGE